MLSASYALRFGVLGAFVASGLYIHFRGKARLKFTRQLTDHSTFIAPYNAIMSLFSKVPRTPRISVEAFPQLETLRANWETIRDEALALHEGGHVRAAAGYNDLAFNTFFKGGWTRFYLKWYDDYLPSAKELCPKTIELIEQTPGINAALFTYLPPRGVLNAHRDPFGGSLRYHLGLATPNSDLCRIYIDDEPYSWRDGEGIVFDETYVHRVKNDTDEGRMILFCDVERPLRTPIVRAINRFMIRHIVKASQTRNVDGEKIGVLNRLFDYVYRASLLPKRVKSFNKTLYYTLKYLLMAGFVYLVFFR